MMRLEVVKLSAWERVGECLGKNWKLPTSPASKGTASAGQAVASLHVSACRLHTLKRKISMRQVASYNHLNLGAGVRRIKLAS